MNKLILAVYLFSLVGLVTSWCDCCDQCQNQQNQNNNNNNNNQGSCPNFEFVNGGLSGSGFASRYWDCCKPSCSWSGNAGHGNEARQCDVNMN